MSKLEFTPGPWFVVRHNSPMKWTIQTKQDGAGECIAQQYEDSPIANARLVSAAPELLEAVKYLRNYAHLADLSGFSADHLDTIIAKAEGR